MLPSTGSNEIQQLRWKSSLGRVVEAGIVEALVVEMPVHAVEPGCHPAAARSEEADAQLRMALDDAAPDHAHRRPASSPSCAR